MLVTVGSPVAPTAVGSIQRPSSRLHVLFVPNLCCATAVELIGKPFVNASSCAPLLLQYLIDGLLFKNVFVPQPHTARCRHEE